MKNTGNGYVYSFSFDYDAIAVDNILSIGKYLMKKHDIKNIWIFKKVYFDSNEIF